MAELSYPSAGGGSVTDAVYENLVGSYVPSGLVGTGDLPQLVYGDSTGRQVKVRANRAAIVRGFRWETDGAGIVRAIDANTSGSTRIDLAVLRLNRADWTVTFQVVKGTPAAAPVAPTPTQSSGPTGVYEIPLANITVPNGATALGGTQVVDRGVYISEFTYSGQRGAPPLPAMNGRIYHAVDVGRTYARIGSSYQIFAESGALTKLTTQASWSTSNVYARRWNGWVYFQAIITRTGNDLPSDTEASLFVLPAVYRPMHDIAAIGYAGGTAMRFYIDGSTGVVTLQDYTVPFRKGASLTIHPIVWPANNIDV